VTRAITVDHATSQSARKIFVREAVQARMAMIKKWWHASDGGNVWLPERLKNAQNSIPVPKPEAVGDNRYAYRFSGLIDQF
jgi:hypothetical protein